MALLDIDGAKSGTLIAAAMESAGISLQADMIQWVSTDGKSLAALLYLIALISAVIAIASGGRYLWGRYLLIGPALFFFLMQTHESSGSTWQHADKTYDKKHIELALRDTNLRGRGDVSLFFKFWNNFMSETTQELLGLLNLTQDDSHLDFLTKTERYMNYWLNTKANLSPNMQRFIRLIMINKCTDYYLMQMAQADEHINQVEKNDYVRLLKKQHDVVVFTLSENVATTGQEWERWLVKEKILEPKGKYTCDDIWGLAIEALKVPAEEAIKEGSGRNLGIGQSLDKVRDKLIKKVGTNLNQASGETLLANGELLQAVHWIIARSLWLEIAKTDKMGTYYNQGGHNGYFASSAPKSVFDFQNNGGRNTNSAIRQFNHAETYKFKADFVNAALAMPYFQGVGLLLLAASFPFFAMAVVVPGRAGVILTWMGLWAWLKLWDVGFGVVMLIDNIMYTVFPRGPALSAGDMESAGKAFSKLMVQDPSYNSAMYYNMISVCMYAVPIVTGVFVKGSGLRLTGLVSDAWEAHSTRLAGSAGSFARALQGQTYVGNQRRQEAAVGAKALENFKKSGWYRDNKSRVLRIAAIRGGGDGAKKALASLMSDKGDAEVKNILKGTVGKVGSALAEGQLEALAAYQGRLSLSMTTSLDAYAKLQVHQHSAGPGGWWAAESAVASKYYSHDTATKYPGGAIVKAMLARQYINQEKLAKANYDPLFQLIGDGLGGAYNMATGGSTNNR